MNLDVLAVAWLAACWAGYTWFADRLGIRRPSLRSSMAGNRERWMLQSLTRANRITDTSLIANLMSSVSFFASTTIFILAGLVAVLGAAERARDLLSEIPYVVRTSAALWDVKVLLLLVMFIYAFFKFTWSLRQFNYACILIGGFPSPDAVTAEDRARARRTARLLSLAGDNFNSGLRAYYFGLGTLSWFMHPALFMLVCGWVVLVLYRREFRSKTLDILCGPQEATDRAQS